MEKLAPLSVVIIAKNASEHLLRCLQSVRWVKEIIVIDNGSTDDTVSLAKSNHAKVIINSSNNFSILRNIGKNESASDWILYLDTDEYITPDLKKEIMHILSDSSLQALYSGFELRRENYYLGKKWPKQEKMLRLIKKEALIEWRGNLHETPILSGSVSITEHAMIHTTHETLTSMTLKTNNWSNIEALLRYQSSHPTILAWRFFRVMITEFVQYYIIQRGWSVGVTGIIESVFQAFSIFITYAKLWEMQYAKKI